MSEENSKKQSSLNELSKQSYVDSEPDSLEFNRLASRIQALKHGQVLEIIKHLGEQIPQNSTKNGLSSHLLMLCKNNDKAAEYVLNRRMPKQCSYDFICVVDFEATCVEQTISTDFYPHEIIEFPAVLIDVKQLQIVDSFHSYVKPVINPILSDFCKEFTGISQVTVDQAKKFGKVLKLFQDWLFGSVGKGKFIILTDGSADIENFLSTSCIVNDVKIPSYAKKWIDMKAVYRNTYMLERGSKRLVDILKKLGIEFEGRLHSGMDDAQNIAKIAITALKDGVELKFTNKLRTQKYKQLKQNILGYMKKNASAGDPVMLMLQEEHEENEKVKKQKTEDNVTVCHHSMDIDPDIEDTEAVLSSFKRKR
ncbi:3'-5' exoribonuclease 1-like [Uloborus diversus]|uniref:3'-5' exoribonuclease 1-like n=1 Tax=Uloborus diversus TaxID=327109 RepID=UPI002409A8E3|nr:3'-5' exoribonuclease 1-like [Uloborus diversus]